MKFVLGPKAQAGVLHRAGCHCGSVLERFVKQERVGAAFSSTQCVFPRRYEKCSWGGMKTNMLCLQEGNVKTVVGARGGQRPGGPGPLGRAGLEDFFLFLLQ